MTAGLAFTLLCVLPALSALGVQAGRARVGGNWFWSVRHHSHSVLKIFFLITS